ncbi:hypothetical protein ACJIZ3_016295 [Penstemon smallii]|uniref:Uncharacterized protein n=1 Tax=Penstemon smallii TaxID=265156 RepID=A0ABD3RQ04_9LAMI
MAFLQYCAPAPHSITALHRPYAGIPAPSLTFITPARYNLQSYLYLRVKNEVRLQVIKRKWSRVFASNTNPPEGSDEAKTAQGPPFLTILAGLVVFLVMFWIIGSIVTWLIGLIVHPPPLK